MFEFVRRVSGAGWWVSQICYLTVEAGTEVNVTDRYSGVRGGLKNVKLSVT